jgi:putative transposase
MSKKTFTRKASIRLRDFDYRSNKVYFVTIVVKDRRKAFLNQEFAEESIRCLLNLREDFRFWVFSYCFMPDHFHGLISPGNSEKSLGEICGAFKSLTTRISWKWYQGRLWQRQYYDHIIRNEDDFFDCLEYIKLNPVKAGLVNRPEDWKWTGRCDYLY